MLTFLISSVVVPILVSMLWTEIDARGPKLARLFLGWAVRRLPISQQERYYEQWSADIEAQSTSMSKVVFAFGLMLAAPRMRLQLEGLPWLISIAQEWCFRSLDILFASMLLIFLAPLMLTVSTLLYITDPGPVIYGHRRIGQYGREFRCFKFRSLAPDSAERLAGLLEVDKHARIAGARDHKPSNDPRFTLLGRLLRETSLDELPQLFNVLRGEMSLVGPRAIIPEKIERYRVNAEHLEAVRPGVLESGQVLKGDIDTYRRRSDLDVSYASSRSIRLYLLVLLRTVGQSFRKSSGCTMQFNDDKMDQTATNVQKGKSCTED